MNTPINLNLSQIEYSCSPGGVDTWELYSISGNCLGDWIDIKDAMQFIYEQFKESKIVLEINTLENWHNQEENK
jgi:hypothetical protein